MGILFDTLWGNLCGAIRRGDDANKVMAMIPKSWGHVNVHLNGTSPLRLAVHYKREKIVQLLLEHPNTDPNIRDLVAPYHTPLHSVICSIYWLSCELNSIDAQQDPLDVKVTRSNYEASVRIAKLLLERDDIDICGGVSNHDSHGWKEVLQNPDHIPDELWILMKKRAKEQFRNSQLKKFWERIMPGLQEKDGKKVPVRSIDWDPGMVELQLAPFLLRTIPEPKNTSDTQ